LDFASILKGPDAPRIYKFLLQKFENLMTLCSSPHCPEGKVALFPIFALSFSSSIFNINTVLLSTTEHFKISGSCFILPLLP
jgi:hypothetical protein